MAIGLEPVPAVPVAVVLGRPTLLAQHHGVDQCNEDQAPSAGNCNARPTRQAVDLRDGLVVGIG